MEPIRITPVSEKLYSRTPERAGGYLEIVERIGVDQYGREWHNFHRRFISDFLNPPTDDEQRSLDANNSSSA